MTLFLNKIAKISESIGELSSGDGKMEEMESYDGRIVTEEKQYG